MSNDKQSHKCISVFCGSKENVVESYRKPIRQVIEHLATSGFRIAYGGGMSGLMKEVYDVCQEHNISLTSINCTRWKHPLETTLEQTVYYDNITDRQNHLVNIADAYLIFPGGVGTLYELLQVITLNDVKEANKPIFIFNYNNYFMFLFDFMNHARKLGIITKTNADLNVHVRDNPLGLAQCIQETFHNVV
jgi:uncharacterized protein (TIGR00730 family)